MPLQAGQTLSFYEILAPLGAGGMGEVYRARDTRLERDVAIKVLPEELADDDERLMRFEREAKTLASLNHTNVAGVFGIDQVEDICFIAMELVPGEDLEQRLARGALPVDEATDVCGQIAAGLEVAHEAGVVHRDLKPANVRITPEGVVKILDFGLAKPLHPKTGSGGTSTSEKDSFLVTEEGLVLGTPTYMSPEQARGKAVDRRTDIWAFGCVLYECLTGRRAFDGGSLTDVLAAIVGQEPDMARLPELPGRLRELLRRCLAKDPRMRLRDIGEARVWLEDPSTGSDPGQAMSRVAQAPRSHRIGVWVLVPLLGLLAAAGWVGRFSGATAEADPTGPTHFMLADRVTDQGAWRGNTLAISGDARTIAYQGVPGDTRLHLRAMDAFEARPVPGTEGASSPFFSADGTEVGYWSDGKLMKVPVAGGMPTLLANTSRVTEASWGAGGKIAANVLGRLVSIDPRSGEIEPLVQDTEAFIDSPSIVPGRGAILFDRRNELCVLSTDGTWRELGQGGLNPKWSATGHVIFQAMDATVWARPFDPQALAFVGDGVTLIDRPVLDFDVALDGTLIFVPGLGGEMELVWVDRDGAAQPVGFPPAHYLVPRISPEEGRIAVSIQEGAGDQTDLWVLELDRGGKTRITTDGKWNVWAVWTHAGTRLAYMGDGVLWIQAADGSSGADRLMPNEGRFEVPISWSEQDQALAFYDYGQAGDLRVWYDGDGVAENFLATRFDERSPHFSPDGRWIAYVSDQSGSNEVYVRPHARGQESTRRFSISTGGGGEPRWSPDGKELFYRHGTRMFSVSFGAGAEPEIGAPRLLFDGSYMTHPVGRSNPNYDVADDGRFLMIRIAETAEVNPTVIHVMRGIPELSNR